MKKKGLIISTVVMVIVLIASLTTATYAWFSATSTAVVGDIGMSATAADGIVIGAANKATPSERMDFDNGAVLWNKAGSVWAGANHGLGSSVIPQQEVTAEGATTQEALNFKLDRALTKKADKHTADAVKDLANGTFIKAEGKNGDDTQTNDETWAKADINEDYFDMTFGVAATSDKTVQQVICTITVKATDTANIGLAAAIHFNIAIKAPGATDWTNIECTYTDGTEVTTSDLDSFAGLETSTTGFGTGKTSVYGTYDATAGTWTFSFIVAEKTEGFAVTGSTLDIAQVRVVSWVEGEDGSCRNTNTGDQSGATIGIAFDYTKTTDTARTFANGKETTVTP